MAIDPNLLFAQGPTSNPIDDAGISGGTLALIGSIGGTYFGITQPVTPTVVEVLSDNGADTTQEITIVGRDDGGLTQTEVVTLNGTTAVILGTTIFSYIQLMSTDKSYTGNITLRVSVAGAAIAILALFPQMSQRVTMFKNSFSDALLPLVRYEKMFWRNANVESLLSADITLVADPSTVIKQGIVIAKDDGTQVINRLTTPVGVTFVDDSVAQAVPTGSLLTGESIGCWYEQTLAPSAPATSSSFTTQLAGQDLP